MSSAKDSWFQGHSKNIYLMVSIDESSGRNFMISEFQFNLTAVWKRKKWLSCALKITEIGDNGKKLFTKISNPG